LGAPVSLENFSSRVQSYALVKKQNKALPADPTPTSGEWVAGDSLLYGVYGLPATFPALYPSSAEGNDGARNEIFTQIKAKMTAAGNTLTLL